MATSEYRVSGMSCGHCETAIQREVGHIPGVHSVEVSARTGRLIVASSVPIEEATVLDAVNEAGFTAVVVA
ncbi:heavy-metal-associated domain-containing protein [Mycobacterium haemophilum]|uniref:Heavy metal transporter n=1 Tax=Mycobacterium haemophilum TaxID=29311 RepID=A0A0I9TUP2_9MYCO|nr:heavy metal-associated domain-containing protein [Mycobacterium haemophilum]AKN15611.1 heavy metal transporter [Mycobacterium haemophilum DSM 44634]KLO32250.1 heavy metal transporter [Mycobacterium haemophilum]KLO36657.1 heavy metal transporter [Mycobacterium haemophilum]KLO42585.1 heavy metal transporter [Mycobacterium haemophilum]KLO55461.1 heavy metal transporter [Mycobacterium haemophilum]